MNGKLHELKGKGCMIDGWIASAGVVELAGIVGLVGLWRLVLLSLLQNFIHMT